MLRVLVCGDRDWSDFNLILEKIDELRPILVIEGEQRGADKLARRAAEARRIPFRGFPAHWRHDETCRPGCQRTEGKAAGPIRNSQMLKEGRPNLVIAFHDDLEGRSVGTMDMVRKAQAAGIPVRVFTHRGEEEPPALPERKRAARKQKERLF